MDPRLQNCDDGRPLPVGLQAFPFRESPSLEAVVMVKIIR